MKLINFLLLATALAYGPDSLAQRNSFAERMQPELARAALQNLDEALDEDLPSLQQALPGYQPPSGNAVNLAVALFSSGPEEPESLGAKFTFMLKHRLVEAAGYSLQTSPVRWEQYRRVVYAGEQSFFLPGQDQELFLQRFRERTGARFGLTGSLAERGDTLYFNIHLRDLQSGESLLEQDYHSATNALPSLMADMIRDVLNALGLAIERPETLRQRHPASLDTLRDILATRCDGRSCSRRQSHLYNVVREKPFPSAYIWLSETSGQEDSQVVDTLQQGLSRWPEHAILKYLLAMHMPRGERRDPNRERMQLITDLAARYPDFLEFQFRAVVDLAWCCYTREALALARSVLQRHPAHYRAWLVYTRAVSRYAWNIRGNHPWSRVPERGRRQFPKLIPLAESAASRSLSLNEYEPDTWVNHAIHPPGATEQTRSALLRAIELAPHDSWAYEAGMLNFRRVWGGSINEQMQFFHLAVENNPRAQWPFDLHRSTYLQGSKWRVRGAATMNRLGCGYGCRQYLGWGLGILLLLMAPLGLLLWHRSRQGYF